MKKKIYHSNPSLLLDENVCIIGSSKSILKKKHGRHINKFKEVVRFNRSTIKNFENYVGRKTTLRILNNHVFLNIKIWGNSKTQNFAKKLRNTKILIISPSKLNKFDIKSNSMKSNSYFFLNSKKILLISFVKLIFFPKVSYLIGKIILNKFNYSAGMSFVMCLILNNFRPTLFGFDLKENMNNRSHYFEKAGKPGKRHNLELEHKILKELQRRNLLYINH